MSKKNYFYIKPKSYRQMAEVMPQKFLVDLWYIKLFLISRVVQKWKIQKNCHYFSFYEFGKTRAW